MYTLQPYFFHYFCGKILRSRFHNNEIHNKLYAEYLTKLKNTNKNPLVVIFYSRDTNNKNPFDEESYFDKELKLKYKENNFKFNT